MFNNFYTGRNKTMKGKPEFMLGFRTPNINNASPNSYEMGLHQKPVSDSRYTNGFKLKHPTKEQAEQALATALVKYKVKCYAEGKPRITVCPTKGNKSFLNSPPAY